MPKGGRVPQRPPVRRAPNVSHSVARARTIVSADETEVTLRYVQNVPLQNGAGGLATKVFQANAAYDVDPVVGSTETIGFDEYAALYSYYRVVGVSYKITMASSEPAPVIAYLLVTNLNPNSVGSNFSLYASNPYCKSFMLGPNTGSSNHTFRGSLRFAKLLGSMAVETSDSFRALTTSNPADLLFVSIGAESTLIATLSNGVFCRVELSLHTRFYGREVDLTLAGIAARMQRHLNARAAHKMKKALEASSH